MNAANTDDYLARFLVLEFILPYERVRFFPDVPEHEAIVDVFLPLR